ncbi:MAG TPA: shikimate dehydrogenase [Cytophagales bacterium]|nr:shikimate dehydrogenase [Cytophagales bacterium]HAA20359.1 shikimate dehydrogenase [Cytophagales bacterium]HAP60859.1 shikimate dehydrogenase [Cytophagales bacterium]
MKQLGLIGYPLGHSFSKKYFSEKFSREGIPGWDYELYPLENIHELSALLENTPNLQGLNVTIPYKQDVMAYCQSLDPGAKRIGAVNTLKRLHDGSFRGFNTDYFGFRDSLRAWAGEAITGIQALILGTGGAAKAIQVALEDLEIPYRYVSRTAREGILSYAQLAEGNHLSDYHLIINTTPLGTAPNTDGAPDLPYAQLTSQHWLYDLVYNPEVTRFMALGQAQGAQTKNGLDMLIGQAEKAWEIWNQSF